MLEKPKYKIGEIVDINSWTGIKKNFKIIDIRIIYHNGMMTKVHGYLLDKPDTGFNLVYIPEGYLISKSESRKEKFKRLLKNEIQ